MSQAEKQETVDHKSVLTKYLKEVNARHKNLPADIKQTLSSAKTKGRAKVILREFLQEQAKKTIPA